MNSLAVGTSILGTIGAVLSALVPAMWAYNGFMTSVIWARNLQPQKNIPRAILIGLLPVAACICLQMSFYFRTLSFASLRLRSMSRRTSWQSFAGAWGAAWLTVLWPFPP